MFTFITGWLIILHVMFARYGGLREFFATSYGWKIFFGGMLGSLMWFNVWFVIWPNQKKALGIVTVSPEAKAAAAKLAGMTSRINTMLSIPMLYCMAAQSHGGF
jgi:uncharacterized membrane protein